jgi:hypothetical protein
LLLHLTAVLTAALTAASAAAAAAGGGSIHRSRLVQLLVFLARDEEAAYKRRSVSQPSS